MRKILYLNFLFLSLTTYSQTEILYDTTECLVSVLCSSKTERIEENIENKLVTWRNLVKKCPDANEIIYIKGVEIFKYLATNSESELKREKYIDSVFLNYNMRIEFFRDSAKIYAMQAVDIIEYRPDNLEMAYDLLQKSIEIEPYQDHFKYLYFVSSSEKLKELGKISEIELAKNRKESIANLNKMIELEEKDFRKEIYNSTIEKIKE